MTLKIPKGFFVSEQATGPQLGEEDVSSGLKAVGRGIQTVSKNLEEVYLKDDKAKALDVGSQYALELAQVQNDLKNNTTDIETYRSSLEQASKQLREKYSGVAENKRQQQMFEEQADQAEFKTQQDAIDFISKQRAYDKVAAVQGVIETQSNMVMTDPRLYRQAKENITEAFETLNLPAGQKEKMKAARLYEFEKAAVYGAIMQEPKAALDRLRGGAFDKLLKDEDKRALMGTAESMLRKLSTGKSNDLTGAFYDVKDKINAAIKLEANVNPLEVSSQIGSLKQNLENFSPAQQNEIRKLDVRAGVLSEFQSKTIEDVERALNSEKDPTRQQVLRDYLNDSKTALNKSPVDYVTAKYGALSGNIKADASRLKDDFNSERLSPDKHLLFSNTVIENKRAEIKNASPEMLRQMVSDANNDFSSFDSGTRYMVENTMEKMDPAFKLLSAAGEIENEDLWNSISVGMKKNKDEFRELSSGITARMAPSEVLPFSENMSARDRQAATELYKYIKVGGGDEDDFKDAFEMVSDLPGEVYRPPNVDPDVFTRKMKAVVGMRKLPNDIYGNEPPDITNVEDFHIITTGIGKYALVQKEPEEGFFDMLLGTDGTEVRGRDGQRYEFYAADIEEGVM